MRGGLAGDLSAQAVAAQHETDQVTIQVCSEELDAASQIFPDAFTVTYWREQLSLWDGGAPTDERDSGSSEAGVFDAEGTGVGRGDN